MSEVIDHLKHRLRHPFLGSFSISFLAWNWRAILIATTGDLTPSDRISQILEVTVGVGEHKNWYFLFEPLIAASIISIIILPLGSLVLGLVGHLSIVIEGNIRDWINKRWNKSDVLKYRLSKDLVSFASGQIGQLRNLTNGQPTVPASEVGKFVDSARGALHGISEDNMETIQRVWTNLRNENKIQ